MPFCLRISYFLVTLFTAITSQACTTFFINHNGQMVFGRNYDWVADAGMVCTNLRGLHKTSMKNEDGEVISWTSKYGSITFNQYGKELPTGGMNEKGLVVELMWLDETKYPPSGDKRPSIGVLQWIQYHLDNCATIDEVIATDQHLRITHTGTPLHYLIADVNGHAATIEFLDGKMKVHRGEQLPFSVLTNNTYDESVRQKNKNISTSDNSLQRFSTACNMIQEFSINPQGKSVIDQSFDILDKVSQGDFTKWRIVYDITNRKIWFLTEQFKQRRAISFDAFDFSCPASPKSIDMNRPEGGDISRLLAPFTLPFNQEIIRKTLRQSSARIPLSARQEAALMAFAGTIHCE